MQRGQIFRPKCWRYPRGHPSSCSGNPYLILFGLLSLGLHLYFSLGLLIMLQAHNIVQHGTSARG